MTIILASRSASRRALLSGAGLTYEARPSDIDEGAVKREELAIGRSPAEIALTLAEKKALACVADADDMIIGADQVMEFDGRLYDKPISLEEAAQRFEAMSGKEHYLRSGMVLCRNGEIIWRHQGTSTLRMRCVTRPEIDHYLEVVGDRVLATVGAYELEGEGVRLFDQIEGDYFSILGLPLLPLLSELRSQGILTW